MSRLGAMELARPWVLWGLALAVPIVLLHLHRRRKVVVPFLPLLREGIGRAHPLGGWRRLRDLAALLARIGALAAVVLALGGLRPAQAGPPPEDLFVVMDADPTNWADEPDGRMRREHVADVARGAILSERWGRVAVLVAGRSPRVLAGPTSRAEAAASLRERASTESGTADLGAAVRLAFAQAARSERARVVVVSAREMPEVTPPPHVLVEVRGAGESRDDQGITDVSVSRGAENDGWRVTVALRNDADVERTRRLLGFRHERVADSGDVVLPPHGERTVTLELPASLGDGGLNLHLQGALKSRWPPDAWGYDDMVDVVLPPLARPSILVVHGGAVRPYTRALLEAMGNGIDAKASGTVLAADLAKATPRDVTIVDGVPLPEGALRPGAWVFLAPLAGALPFAVGAPVQEPLVWRVATGEPLVRDVDLTTAYAARAFPVEAPGLTGLAHAEAAVVVGRGERDGVRYVVLGLDPEGSDLPVRAAFPLLVRNAIRSLVEAQEGPFEPWYRAGRPLRPRQDLPGGPTARVSHFHYTDMLDLEPPPHETVRIARTGETWTPSTMSHEMFSVETGPMGRDAWWAMIAVNDLDPTRTIVPVRAEAPIPPAVGEVEDPEAAWRRRLVLAALGFLVADLLLVRRAVARRAAPEAARAAA